MAESVTNLSGILENEHDWHCEKYSEVQKLTFSPCRPHGQSLGKSTGLGYLVTNVGHGCTRSVAFLIGTYLTGLSLDPSSYDRPIQSIQISISDKAGHGEQGSRGLS